MSNAQVGSCKGRWKGTSRCSAGIVGKGTCRLGKRGGRTRDGKCLGRGREGSGMSGAKVWKVSVVWGGLGRLQLGDGIGLLLPLPSPCESVRVKIAG